MPSFFGSKKEATPRGREASLLSAHEMSGNGAVTGKAPLLSSQSGNGTRRYGTSVTAISVAAADDDEDDGHAQASATVNSKPTISSRASSLHGSFADNYHTIRDGDYVVKTPRHESKAHFSPLLPPSSSGVGAANGGSSGPSLTPNRHDPPWCYALKVLLKVLLLPCIGTFYAYYAAMHRDDPAFLQNRGDWRVVFVIGATLQLALGCPLLLMVDGGAHHSLMQLPTHGDFYGPLVMYPLLCVYFVVLALVFYGLRLSGAFAERERQILEEQKHLKMNKTNFMINLKAELRSKTSVRSELILLLSTGVALCQVAFMRSCLLVNSNTQDYCDNHQPTLFSSPKYRDNVYVWVVTAFWFLLFFVVDAVVFLAVLAYHQEFRQVQVFTMATKVGRSGAGDGGGGDNDAVSIQHAQILRDLYDPRNLAAWAALWEMLVSEVKHNPVTESLRSTTFFANVVVFLSSLLYIGIRNVTNQQGVADFTNGCVAIAAISFFGLVAFVVTTAKLQSAIESHEVTISKAADDCQRALMFQCRDTVEAKQLRSKAIVLQTLDLYNRAAPRYPKLLGLSLETLRWSVIVLGLVILNIFFLFLYVVDCLDRSTAPRPDGA